MRSGPGGMAYLGIQTKYQFRCNLCGNRLRLFQPNRIDCATCGEPMEMSHILKIYPGFGIGQMSVREYFKYGDPHRQVLDNEDEDVV